MAKLTEAQRAELVRELALTKTYQRSHTPTGAHRRLPDPADKEPDLDNTGVRRRLANLRPQIKKKAR